MKNKAMIISALIGIGAIASAYFLLRKKETKSNNIDEQSQGFLTEKKQDDSIRTGDVLYSRGSLTINVRATPQVRNSTPDNKITEIAGLIGTVHSSEVGNDGLTWYKVKLATPLTNVWISETGSVIGYSFKNYDYGYVRADVVQK